MSTSWIYGLAWTLPTLLVVSAVLRSTDIDRSQIFVVQTLPRWMWVSVNSRTWARLIVSGEVAAAVLLVPVPGLALPVREAAGAVLAALFAAIVGRALALHVACGCFPGRRAAEWADLTRSVVLLAETAVVFAARPMFAGGGDDLAIGFVVLGTGLTVPFAAARLVRRAHGHREEVEVTAMDAFLVVARERGMALSELLLLRESTGS